MNKLRSSQLCNSKARIHGEPDSFSARKRRKNAKHFHWIFMTQLANEIDFFYVRLNSNMLSCTWKLPLLDWYKRVGVDTKKQHQSVEVQQKKKKKVFFHSESTVVENKTRLELSVDFFHSILKLFVEAFTFQFSDKSASACDRIIINFCRCHVTSTQKWIWRCQDGAMCSLTHWIRWINVGVSFSFVCRFFSFLST